MTAAHTSRRRVRVSVAGLSVLGLLITSTVASATSPPPDPEVTLSASVVSELQQSSRIADEDPTKTIDVQLSLKLRNRPQLDDLIRRVSTPGSPDYGRYLTPAQFGAQFGPTSAQVNQAAAFLRANGLQVTAATPGSTLVDAKGTVATVAHALHTRIGRYREASGHEFFANDSAPALPSSLAVNVVGIVGLDNRYQRHHAAVEPRVCPPTCAGTPYTPTQLRTGYGLAAAPLTSLTGAGQTLGLLELDDFQQANIDGYDAAYSLPAFTPQRQVVDSGAGISNAGEVEVELDIEVMHALAPGAAIMVFEGPNSPTGLNDTYGCMVNPNAGTNQGPCPNQGSGITASNSTSWGLCEPNQGQAETSALGAIFAQAAAQGQSFFAASGDAGAHDCTPPGGPLASGIAVDSPASDPNVTGAGGTKLLLNPDNSYNSEQAWPPEPVSYYGSGGGQSIYWQRPSWQAGPGVDFSANAPRQVPDISLDADPVTGYSIFTCLHRTGSCDPTAGPPTAGLRTLGGTSAAAPAWAAFAAIYNQYAFSQGKPNLGFANPTLYALGSCPQSFPPFNDVTVGDNKEGTSLGYTAGPNYDMVTGLGSLRAADLSKDLVGAAPQMAISSLDRPRGVSGDTVKIFGCGFQQTPAVTFGGVSATQVNWLTDSALSVVVPTHTLGNAGADVSVVVTNPGGGGSATLANGFHYNRSAGHQQMVSNFDGRLEAFMTGSDGTVYHSWEPQPGGSLGAYSQLGGPSPGNYFVSDPATGLNPDGRLESFVVGSDGAVWHSWQVAPGSGWSSYYSMGKPAQGAMGVPAVASNQDGRLEIFARSSDGSIWHQWQVAPNTGWVGWYLLGAPGPGTFISDVSAGRNGDGRLEIAATDTAGVLWHAFQVAPNTGWTSFGQLPGRAIAGTPAVNTNQDGRLEIFARASNDDSIVHIYQPAPNSGWGPWSSLGGQISRDPAAGRNSDGRLEVFAIDASGNLVHTWQFAPSSGWVAVYPLGSGLTLDGIPATGTSSTGRVKVVAPNLNSQAEWQIYQVSGGGWSPFSSLGGTVRAY